MTVSWRKPDKLVKSGATHAHSNDIIATPDKYFTSRQPGSRPDRNGQTRRRGSQRKDIEIERTRFPRSATSRAARRTVAGMAFTAAFAWHELMRVALIDPSLFTLPYDAALAAGLRDEGHDVLLYGRPPDANDGGLNDAPLVPGFYRFAGHRALKALPNPVRLAIKGADHVASMFWLRRGLRRNPPDVIHFQWLPLPFVDRRFLAGLRRIAPLVLTVHDTNPFNGAPSSGLQGVGMAKLFGAFERLVVHTARGRERLIDQHVDPSRISVLPHGLLGAEAAARATREQAGAIVTFLVFGKIKPYKGIDVLIEAFARLPEELRRNARLRVVGKPYMDLEPLRALAAARGVDPGLDPRFVADDELPGLFASGTIATFPYREIEASGVLSLALANGRPILASRIGGFAESLTDGVHGQLVAPDDPAALATAMARFVRDPRFVAQCESNVAALARAIPPWPEIARRTVEIYAAARAGWAGRMIPPHRLPIRKSVPQR
jgi:glycosyltransferase involved in cell wall biosynthesis